MANKKSIWLQIIIPLLVLCILITATVLFVRLSDFSDREKASVIDITPSDTQETQPEVTATDTSEQGNQEAAAGQNSEDEDSQQTTLPTEPLFVSMPGFEARDTEQIWTSNTQVEIFRLSYENGEHNITVLSEDTDKVVAPGTANEYTFWLKNTGNVPLDYVVWTEAYFSHEENTIPISVKLGRYNGQYYVGSEDSWEEVDRLNDFKHQGQISVNSYDSYTLYWQWPFESGDDAYDTMLGNLAVEEDITLTVEIHTMAVADEDATGGIPTTGDTAPTRLLVMMFILSGAMLIVLITQKRGFRR